MIINSNIKSQISKLWSLPRVVRAKRERSGGFTVLESIVAIFILSLAISGAFSAVRQGLMSTSMAKDEVKAFYLAQEAIEIVRNLRDANRLANANGIPTNWLNIIQGCIDATCMVDITGAFGANPPIYLSACGDDWGACPYLKQQTGNSAGNDYLLYGHNEGSNWTATNFKREMQIEQLSSDEISITVRITWERGILDYEYETQTNLFNLL